MTIGITQEEIRAYKKTVIFDEIMAIGQALEKEQLAIRQLVDLIDDFHEQYGMTEVEEVKDQITYARREFAETIEFLRDAKRLLIHEKTEAKEDTKCP